MTSSRGGGGAPGPPSSPPEGRSGAARALVGLVGVGAGWPRAILLVSGLLCLVSLAITVARLEFDSSRSNLIRREPALQRSLDRFLEEFPQAEDMVVVVEGGEARDREAFVDHLARRLRGEPHLFRDVFVRVELPFLRTHALHYLDGPTLSRLAGQLEASADLLAGLAGARELGGWFQALGGDGGPGDLAGLLPFLNRSLDQLLRSLETRGRAPYVSPWREAFFGEGGGKEPQEVDLEGDAPGRYNTLAEGRLHLLLVRAARVEPGVTPDPGPAVGRLRELLAAVGRTHPRVSAGLTGEPVLDTDEMLASAEDSRVSALQSLALVTLLFAFAFREVGRPLAAVMALILGVGWTMGFTTLAVGHLNLLTVTFATILVGLGIDFGIHFIYRYDEERARGLDPVPAMEVTLAGTGVENLTGAVSTAIAFWVLNLTDFVGIAELGTIAGTGIMLCYLAMVTCLPSALFLLERARTRPWPVVGSWDLLARWERSWLARPGWVVAGCLLFSLGCLSQASRVRYDYNLLNLQARGLESVRWERQLMRSCERSLLFAVSLADGVEEARRLTEAYRRLPEVGSVESVAPMLPPAEPARLEALQRVVRVAARFPSPPTSPGGPTGGVGLEALAGSFQALHHTLEASLPALRGAGDPDLREASRRLEGLLERLARTLAPMGPGAIEDGLNAFQEAFFEDFRGMVGFLKAQQAEPPITAGMIPDVLRAREIGRGGMILVRIFPREDVWEREPLGRFVAAVRAVDPEAVGMPVMLYHDTQELRVANEAAGWYALVAIVLLLFLHFRDLRMTALALFPKAVGVLWMVGIMGWWGVDFNSANFLALPLILGIGLIFGVHVVHRVREEGGQGVFGHSTGPSVALSGLTTMVGFATMIQAAHQGIASLGFVMTVGVGTNLVASVLFLPALLKLLDRWGLRGVDRG